MLRINVGFLLKESIGTSRVIAFDEQRTAAEDVVLDHLHGSIQFTRTAHGILAQGRLQAQMLAECVRCLDEAVVPVGVDLSEHFVYPPATAADGERSVGDDGFINLTPILREDAILSIPMHVLCKTGCLGLCSQCGQNRNEAQCECDHSPIDPRLAALKALLDE